MHRQSMFNKLTALALVAILSACAKADSKPASNSPNATTTTPVSSGDTPVPAADANQAPAPATSAGQYHLSADDQKRVPNELGRIPVVEYHLIVDRDAQYSRDREHFKRDLADIYRRGYRPVTISQLLDRKIDLPRGLSPIVFVFDDASPSQFSYIENNGKLEIDPNSGMGIWLAFRKTHPDWDNRAVFCLLSGAAAGHNFFGNRGIDGQKDEWRFKKVQFLHDQGFEVCNHTLWHANLGKYSDAVVQEQIARGQLAIDSALPNFKVRTFALPLGVWPKNRALAKTGSWTDPKTHQVTKYDNDAILEVSGGPTKSPYDPTFNPLSITRIEMIDDQLTQILDKMDKNGTRYVSDGDPSKVAKPAAVPADK